MSKTLVVLPWPGRMNCVFVFFGNFKWKWKFYDLKDVTLVWVDTISEDEINLCTFESVPWPICKVMWYWMKILERRIREHLPGKKSISFRHCLKRGEGGPCPILLSLIFWHQLFSPLCQKSYPLYFDINFLVPFVKKTPKSKRNKIEKLILDPDARCTGDLEVQRQRTSMTSRRGAFSGVEKHFPQLRVHKFDSISTPENSYLHQCTAVLHQRRRASRSIGTKLFDHFFLFDLCGFYPSDQNELYHPHNYTKYEMMIIWQTVPL